MCSYKTEPPVSVCKNNLCKKKLIHDDNEIDHEFCNYKCRKSFVLQNALKLSSKYKDTVIAVPVEKPVNLEAPNKDVIVAIPTENPVSAKDSKKSRSCQREGCCNTIKRRSLKSKYCSQACSSLVRKKYVICSHEGCNNYINIHSSSKFCSRACYLKDVAPKRTCGNPNCSNVVHGGKRFVYCSEVCYTSYKFGYINKNKSCQREGCDNEIKHRGSKRKFCSHDCYLKKRFPVTASLNQLKVS